MKKAGKIALRVGLSLVGLTLFVFLAIVAVVNLVMTDARLRPIIESYAHDYLDADVRIGEAQGSFFNSFPYVGVRLDSVVVVSNAFHGGPSALDSAITVVDSTRMRRDTLAKINKVIVGLDIAKFLASNMEKLTIGVVYLQQPKLRLITDSIGRNNWDVVRPTLEEEESDTTSSSMDISVRHVKIDDATIAYFSWPEQTAVFVDSVNLKVDGDMGLNELDAKLKLDILKTTVGYKDNRLFHRMPMGLDGRVAYDSDSSKFLLDKLVLSVATADISFDGWLQPDSTGIDMDLKYGLATPSAEKLFAAIPKSIVSTPVDIKNGSLDLQGIITGRLAENQIPLIKSRAYIDKIHAQYKGRPEEIEDVTAEFNVLVDQTKPDSSYVNLDIFHFKGGKTEVSAIVKISQLLTDAMMDCNLKAHVDFGNLQRVIPFDNTSMTGTVDADVKTYFAIKDVMNQNFGRAKLDGTIKVDSLRIVNDTMNFNFRIDADLNMKTDKFIELKSHLARLEMKAGDMQLRATDGGFEAQSEFREDTTSIVPVKGSVFVNRFFFRGDSIGVFAKNFRTKDEIVPQESDPTKPHGRHAVKVDTIFAGVVGNRIFAQDLTVALKSEQVTDTVWHNKALLKYSKLNVRPTFYRLPIRTENFKMTMDGDSVNVNSVTVMTGKNTLRASGYVRNLFRSLKTRKSVSINFNVEADTIDCNELMANVVTEISDSSKTLSADFQSEVDSVEANPEAVAMASDTVPHSSLILVPRKVKLNFSTKAKKVKWNTLTLNDVVAEIKTKRGAAHVTNLSFKMGEDSRSISIMAYKAWPNLGKARANIFSRWERTDLATISQALGLDTMIPALKPIQGKLDCYMAAEVEMDSLMNINLNTARASIHLGGQKLVLMDNESFRKIGKMLMFKNKDKNVIDTLALNVLLDSGRLQVLPTVINIDRYRMAVGGEQTLDMKMNYHVSILKSPLPFKAGVTITGTPEDFDVDITTAKLKKQVTDDKLAMNDSISLLLRMNVLRNSYILSGQPIPTYLKKIKGLEENPRFAMAIKEDQASEKALREAEEARRAAQKNDTTNTVTDTVIATVPDTTEATSQKKAE